MSGLRKKAGGGGGGGGGGLFVFFITIGQNRRLLVCGSFSQHHTQYFHRFREIALDGSIFLGMRRTKDHITRKSKIMISEEKRPEFRSGHLVRLEKLY